MMTEVAQRDEEKVRILQSTQCRASPARCQAIFRPSLSFYILSGCATHRMSLNQLQPPPSLLEPNSTPNFTFSTNSPRISPLQKLKEMNRQLAAHHGYERSAATLLSHL
eukprot:TRINITY_DN30411_c0_g1_i1.p1 TRINITY_DN30411_c0_g1~~TRINITY_DN30411_c0_g1_i1.p1  ORF type:complete len:109 (-),score=14.58 TRINITY_DN30411_c0_g1_i1:312-638(-)